MAKEKNTTEVTGGITRPGLLDGIQFETSDDNPGRGPVQPRQPKNQLAAGYRGQVRSERRNIKMNIMIKPSTAKLLDAATEKGEIRSRNDLINYLLEEYFKNR